MIAASGDPRVPADTRADAVERLTCRVRRTRMMDPGRPGCQQVSVTAAGKAMATMVSGPAAAAAPRLATDLDVIVGAPKPGAVQPQGVGPGGHISLPGGQGRLPDSSRSNSPSLTPSTNASHSASVK